MPPENERFVLGMYRSLKAVPGRFVPLATLLINWPPSRPGAALADAIEALVAAGLLAFDASEKAASLTEAGLEATTALN